ncbi:MAG: hypothetical protein A2275_12885 [Bacteroidetes bacterium RIFOXYA12_FULL_35_11]|nr:MAG: hypothetical protein A2X01_05735 [Bacteroidetes bacterium GWF2_35_48]OFY72607.1 MAG: hypothetical protein A2275_12885 [Bacteroidetes bacterium RIFOXYA12_FULL_35_11]OFY93369.1 MAG: hypothetical protein A2491_06495 [Bacteroidetes bacterium RIFOXYC12_FULL_35_7]HBX52540.1 hypothetical protein [Bacteroidales bacterium]
MKSIKLVLFGVLVLYTISSFCQINVNENGQVVLHLQAHRGTVQWQQSADSISWSDIAGANDSVLIFIAAATAYYRAVITENTCQPYITIPVKVTVQAQSFVCGDLLIDSRDGKEYPTVLIGNQCWMAKNMDIGEMLTGTTSSSNNSIIEKYCYADNAANCATYGGMYMWDEAMNYNETESSQGICPDGWHIPGDYEWKILEISLGMTPADADLANTWRGTDQGTQLKAGGTSGYNALLSGGRTSSGSFMVLNSYEYMWSSNASGSNAWRRCLRSEDAQVGRWDTFPKTYSFSVRCVKNN